MGRYVGACVRACQKIGKDLKYKNFETTDLKKKNKQNINKTTVFYFFKRKINLKIEY